MIGEERTARGDVSPGKSVQERAKERFLRSINAFECCGIVWRNGTKCLSRLCPVEKEIQKLKAGYPAIVASAAGLADALRTVDGVVAELVKVCAAANAVLFARTDGKHQILSLQVGGIWLDFVRIDGAGAQHFIAEDAGVRGIVEGKTK